MKFAAYDFSIYGVGDTAEEAVAKARSKLRDDDAEFNVASISDDLAAQIELDGWDSSRQTFEIDNNTRHDLPMKVKIGRDPFPRDWHHRLS
jgi:hypothetical protein